MNVDLEAIAQRGRCDVSSLRIALPLLQQGYSPPFLARYRRDELGGLDEASLWALSTALQTEQAIASRREELIAVWEATPLQDPAIGHAIRKANSKRMLERLSRRLRAESSDHGDESVRLAVRVLNPRKGDGNDSAAIAEKTEGIQVAAAAVAGLDAALATRLAGDPRVISSAVRWLVKNARIHIAAIHDPHTGGDERQHAAEDRKQKSGSAKKDQAASPSGPSQNSSADPKAAAGAGAESAPPSPSESVTPVPAKPPAKTSVASASESLEPSAPPTPAADPGVSETAADAATPSAPSATPESATTTPPTTTSPTTPSPTVSATDSATDSTTGDASVAPPERPADETAGGDTSASATGTPETGTPETGTPETGPAEPVEAQAAGSKAPAAGSKNRPASQPSDPTGGKSAKKTKKISPRQRRRRWLVSVLKPLEGKRLPSGKLSAFQVVMLSRALRSQVAQCSFEYDAAKLVAELQRTAGGLNRHIEDKLRDIVLQNEADIREAAEGAWWDELQERASTRLVGIAADHLRRQTDRGGVPAQIVMSIDAVGPRTAATTIVAADGRLLHSEDLPCQLSAAPRSQAVARMGELIHTHHVDLIVISNGPSRRACMVAVGDLIGQSPAKSLRWTLADRSGADAYAGSPVADQEMRSTPRRFRAAAWLAFSVLQPAQALAKVDPLKLRLGSFQRELSDDAMLSTLEDVMVSGASRGGVDVNAAPISWLVRLPGVATAVAEAIDQSRRSSLFGSRQALADLQQWDSAVDCRQALPFLRVFASEEVLDGTLIHPDDYPLAKKLATSLEIEMPPAAPPGYVAPSFEDDAKASRESSPAESAATDSEKEPASGGSTEASQPDEASSQPDQPADDPQPVADAASVDETANAGAQPTEPSTAAEEQSLSADESGAAAPQSDDPVADGSESSEIGGEHPPATDSSSQVSDSESTDAAEPVPPAADSDASAEPSPAAAPAIPDAILRPKPDAAKVNKCIKEWQVGSHRVRQLVHWLCDPFGDGDASGVPPAVLSTMPSLATLRPGDQVVGVIVGVMPFGVFVELAPDCSGLIHVSKVSDGFVEDLHEAVQVGDVVTAWVTGVDEKRRRVALSAVSPEREAELQQQRVQRDSRGGGRPPRGGQPSRGGPPRRDQRGAASSDQSRGGKPGGGRPGGGKPRGERGAGGGGRSRDRRGGQRGQARQPESYRVVSKEPAKPITEEMKKGAEPLRSFGDLLQFYSKEESPPAKEAKPKAKAAESKAKTEESPPPEPAPPQDGGGACPPKAGDTVAGDTVASSQPADAAASPPDSQADAQVNRPDQSASGQGDSQPTTKEPPAPSDASSS